MSLRRGHEPRVMREPPSKIEASLALKPRPCGHGGPLEKAEFIGVEGQTERPVSWTEGYRNPSFGMFFGVLRGMARHKTSNDVQGRCNTATAETSFPRPMYHFA